MGEDKGFIEKHKLAFLAVSGIIIIGLILLILLIIVSVFLFFNFSSSETSNTGLPNNSPLIGSPNNPTYNSNNPALPKFEGWDSISKSVVEQACLIKAKEFVGDLAWGVSSCACSASESDSIKSYGCSVSALDGQHPFIAECVRADSICNITSDQGDISLTFSELEQLSG
ncbi:MAG: hypothetical protein CL944_02540 [Candidatus Diapherotrites archaeon]|uniref:Uncharacterized protein n=1 Tax=Candidatus Iainarchaeum sp. TaxID=3101447 RepID=A0A2D6LQ55_9ARCH|nr:hypothetical protein [Candidatus Diapherotrites archaeon]|tara:strand:+ start:30128 stop:30637 length:510 start_codon:yes stop_codon:yes gene_type:complete